MRNNVISANKSGTILTFALVSVILPVCLSCNSFSVFTKNQSWRISSNGKIAGTVWIAGIEADKAGMRSSLENEAACLLPLLLSDLKYLVTEENENTDFIINIKMREREFMRGWKTVNSVSIEAYFLAGKNSTAYKEGMPVLLAAGRAVSESGRTLSSSKTLHSLLKTAIRQAVSALEKRQ
ncbi:MAG: hypothetical protein LBH43_13955 [Treponema sp.]|jgi:hypothetical protein|nr:hypothetical protein [Treponema sp.]